MQAKTNQGGCQISTQFNMKAQQNSAVKVSVDTRFSSPILEHREALSTSTKVFRDPDNVKDHRDAGEIIAFKNRGADGSGASIVMRFLFAPQLRLANTSAQKVSGTTNYAPPNHRNQVTSNAPPPCLPELRWPRPFGCEGLKWQFVILASNVIEKTTFVSLQSTGPRHRATAPKPIFNFPIE